MDFEAPDDPSAIGEHSSAEGPLPGSTRIATGFVLWQTKVPNGCNRVNALATLPGVMKLWASCPRGIKVRASTPGTFPIVP